MSRALFRAGAGLLVLCFAWTARGYGQESGAVSLPSRIGLGIGISGSFLVSHISRTSDYWRRGAGIHMGLDVVLGKIVALQGRVNVTRVPMDLGAFRANVFDAGTTLEGGDAYLVTVLSNIRATFTQGAIAPFVAGGPGWIRTWWEDIDVSDSSQSYFIPGLSAGSVAVNLGGGLEIAAHRRVGFVAEARWIASILSRRKTKSLLVMLGASWNL